MVEEGRLRRWMRVNWSTFATTDDSPVIQWIVDHGGGRVPAGNFRIRQQINVTSRITLTGDSAVDERL